MAESTDHLDEVVASFVPGVSVQWIDGHLEVTAPSGKLCLRKLSAPLANAFVRLNGTGFRRRLLCDEVAQNGSAYDLAKFHYELGRLERHGLVTYTVMHAGQPFAGLTPISPGFRWRNSPANRSVWQLSRFAYCRQEK